MIENEFLKSHRNEEEKKKRIKTFVKNIKNFCFFIRGVEKNIAYKKYTFHSVVSFLFNCHLRDEEINVIHL